MPSSTSVLADQEMSIPMPTVERKRESVERIERLIILGACEAPNSILVMKFLTLVSRMDCPAEYWGWQRDRRQNTVGADAYGMRERVLLRGGGYSNRLLIVWYVLWMCRVFVAVMCGPRRVGYFCNRFECALPLAVASLFRDCRFMFCNSDNVSISHRWPRPIRKLLKSLERFIARRAQLHLVPGKNRWKAQDRNVRLIQNWPTSWAAAEAQHTADSRGFARTGRFTVYVSGWLPKTRGLRMILEAARALRDSEIHFVAAGMPECAEAQEFIALDNVEYLGRVSEAEALAQYHRCDVALAFYDPCIEINRLAEPNKWYDCVVTGTPFITNTQIVTSRPFLESEACFEVGYDDERALEQLLRTLSTRGPEWKRACAGIASMLPNYWDLNMQNLVNEFRHAA